jgi:hypothetical protein
MKPNQDDIRLVSNRSPYVEWDESIVLPSRRERHRRQSDPSNGKARLRQKRQRFLRRVRAYRVARRVIGRSLLLCLFLLLVFWWKFVYVYDFPEYMHAQYPDVKGYIAWKPWTFGPPLLDLRAYGNPRTHVEMTQYMIRMDAYREVIERPFIICRIKAH